MLVEICQNSQENTCARVSFLIKLTLAQVFSCEFVQNAISQQLILQMIKKLEWVLETNLQFPVIFKTGKETFILRGNVQNQSKNKERACLK